jgi:hypothetical protein
MSSDVQRQTGCVIGRDYAAPIVDHRRERQRALERYGAASGGRRTLAPHPALSGGRRAR